MLIPYAHIYIYICAYVCEIFSPGLKITGNRLPAYQQSMPRLAHSRVFLHVVLTKDSEAS